MATYDYVKGKSAEQILSEIGDTAQVNSPVFETMREAITVRCAADLGASLDRLRASIDSANASSGQLAERVYKLNRWLMVATFIGAFATAVYAITTIAQLVVMLRH